MNGNIATTSASALLHDVRVSLLHLHQTLLDMERKSFETTHGRVNSGELLQLTTSFSISFISRSSLGETMILYLNMR